MKSPRAPATCRRFELDAWFDHRAACTVRFAQVIDEGKLDQTDRGARVGLYAGYGLVAALVIGTLWVGYSLFLRSPRPAAICRQYAALLEDHDFESHDIAPESGLAATRRESFLAQCEWYFEGLSRAPNYAKLGRCIVWASDAEQANACWDQIDIDVELGRERRDRELDEALAEFPTAVPPMPTGLEAEYAVLVEIAKQALPECTAIFSPSEGCYSYVLAEQVDLGRKDLARPIPGPRPSADAGLEGLEVSCRYDIPTWVERHPEIIEQLRGFPLPAQQLGCNFLPEGPIRTANCVTGSVRVGGRDNVAIVSEADPDRYGADPARCTRDLTFFDLRHTTGDGVIVEVTATFRR